MKRVIAILLCAAMAVTLLAGCGEDKGKEVVTSDGTKIVEKKDGSISLDVEYEKIGEASEKKEANVPDGGKHVLTVSTEESQMLIAIGKTATIKPVIAPADAADPSVYYVSDNEEVAKVDKDGKVLGVEAGCTTISVISNDRSFKAKVQVIVYRVANSTDKITEMLGLLNQARKDAELAEIEVDEILNYAATERAFEEAAEAKGTMDDTRPVKDSAGDAKAHSTVLKDYDVWYRGQTRIYVWKTKASVKDAYDAIMANEENKALILSENGSYTNIGAGCFEYKDVTYWCILMYKS